MCEMRLALESYAAGFAATNRTDEELREMGAAMEEMRRLSSDVDHEEATRLDGDRGSEFGTLPPGADVARILARTPGLQ